MSQKKPIIIATIHDAAHQHAAMKGIEILFERGIKSIAFEKNYSVAEYEKISKELENHIKELKGAKKKVAKKILDYNNWKMKLAKSQVYFFDELKRFAEKKGMKVGWAETNYPKLMLLRKIYNKMIHDPAIRSKIILKTILMPPITIFSKKTSRMIIHNLLNQIMSSDPEIHYLVVNIRNRQMSRIGKKFEAIMVGSFHSYEIAENFKVPLRKIVVIEPSIVRFPPHGKREIDRMKREKEKVNANNRVSAMLRRRVKRAKIRANRKRI